jgi:regulator of cell morphogenesis and NO signaling
MPTPPPTPAAPETDTTVAELANHHGGAAAVFDRHGIAYWRDGRLPLAKVCEALGEDPAALVAEIAAADLQAAPAQRWDERPLADLVEHLVERYHQPSVTTLVALDGHLRKVGAARMGAPDYKALRRAFDLFREEYVHHMQTEERVVFRMIRTQVSFIPRVPLRVMRAEHDQAMGRLAQLRAALDALVEPGDAAAVAAFRTTSEDLGRELRMHTHLENNVLFPRAFAELDARLTGAPPEDP